MQDVLVSRQALGIAGRSEPLAGIRLRDRPAIRGLPGHEYVLHAHDAGSLQVGSPVLFRRVKAGEVIAYRMDPDGSGVTLRIFIDSPYDRFVTTAVRFWHASGIDLTLDAAV